MNTLTHFSASPIMPENVDSINGVIRGVSVISAGIARGHGLEVDGVTLAQMEASARVKKQIPTKLDHGSGAASICGFLQNFRREGGKLLADWHLLESHAQRDQIIETAQRMPGGVGLSAAFVSPENGEPGKARCNELISVDYVTLPAANPNGLFSREFVPAMRTRPHLPHDFAARVSQTFFNRRLAYAQLRDAVQNNVSFPGVPGTDTAGTAIQIAKKPLVRRIGTRLLKIGAGATLGHFVGRKAGGKAGAIAGAVAGALFESPEVRNRVRLSIIHANGVTKL